MRNNRQGGTEDYIYILKKYKNREALEKCYDLDEEEVEKYLNQLQENGEIISWNFWQGYNVPDFDYQEIELKDDDE